MITLIYKNISFSEAVENLRGEFFIRLKYKNLILKNIDDINNYKFTIDELISKNWEVIKSI